MQWLHSESCFHMPWNKCSGHKTVEIPKLPNGVNVEIITHISIACNFIEIKIQKWPNSLEAQSPIFWMVYSLLLYAVFLPNLYYMTFLRIGILDNLEIFIYYYHIICVRASVHLKSISSVGMRLIVQILRNCTLPFQNPIRRMHK